MKKGFALAEVLMPKRTSGIENKVLYSRESEGQAPSKTNKKLAAFTLAEVLITLVIIGVVAALTIPVVVHKYQQKVYYTQFTKVFNTIANAINLSVAENGFPGTWTYNGSVSNVAEQYILPYLKVTSKCNTSDSSCGSYSASAVTGDILGGTIGQLLMGIAGGTADIYTLADGALVSVARYTDNNITFVFDTNGAKGPNIFGRDIFYLRYTLKSKSIGSSKYTYYWAWYGEYRKDGQKDNSGSIVIIRSNCDPGGMTVDNGMVNGTGCGERLIIEGKMNY